MIKERNTFIQAVKEDVNDFIETEVGDLKQDKFFPQVKVKRFDNEFNLSVRYKHNGNGKETVEEKDGKVIWKQGKEEARFYEIEGAHEFEVILKEKPESNIIEFTLQTKGLDFYYQGELTEEEIAMGHERPENVIGSYAVYSSKKKINYSHGKKYGVGKICHIYRPKIIDSNGNFVWANLTINEKCGIMIIEIQQEFLDSAAYPVIVDPTIGYNVAGGSSAVAGSADFAIANVYNNLVAATGDVSTGISFYAKKNNNNESVTVSLYTFSGGEPDTRVGTESTINVNSTTAQWWSSPTTSDALTNGVEYCVAYGSWGGTVGNENTRVYYDSGSSGDGSYNNSNSTTATWNESATFSQIWSIYATYVKPPIDINYSYNIFIDLGKL